MRTLLAALAKLSEIDASAREIDNELRKIPARMAEIKADADRLEALLGRERTQLADAETLKRGTEEDIARANDTLAKSKAKAAKAKTAREAEAVERELELARRTVKEREADRDRLTAAIETQSTALTSHQADYENLRALTAEEQKSAEARAAELETERNAALSGRDEVTAKIPKQVLRRYEQVREKRGTAVAEVRDGTCLGCRVAIPPQLVIKLQRAEGQDPIQCPHCLRILFHKSLIED